MNDTPIHEIEPSARPFVTRPRQLLSLAGIGLTVLIMGGLLFWALNAHRLTQDNGAQQQLAEQARSEDREPPPLELPPADTTLTPYGVRNTAPNPFALGPTPQVAIPAPRAIPTRNIQPKPPSSGAFTNTAQNPQIATPGLAYANTVLPPPNGVNPLSGTGQNNGVTFPGHRSGDSDEKTPLRTEADRLANPSTTVIQGTILHAVLETALDSTKAGAARALISRDAYGFDGSKVLIPRGSRLYGEYHADLANGQKRALVIWSRLIRPDGATINLESPSADPLGRAGIGGKVHDHFLERFGAALVQTALNLGTAIGTNAVSNGSTTVVALPGGTIGNAVPTPLLNPGNIQPSLTVRQGISVSVFVAHDLDFTSVEKP